MKQLRFVGSTENGSTMTLPVKGSNLSLMESCSNIILCQSDSIIKTVFSNRSHSPWKFTAMTVCGAKTVTRAEVSCGHDANLVTRRPSYAKCVDDLVNIHSR